MATVNYSAAMAATAVSAPAVPLSEDNKGSTEPARDQPVASRTRRLSSASSQRLFSPASANSEVAAAATTTTPTTTTTSTTTMRTRNATSDQQQDAAACKELPVKKVAEMLAKASEERTAEEARALLECQPQLIQAAESYLRAKQEKKILKQRLLEVEESLESIEAKVDTLADLIRQSRHTIVYTGAGISTSASIPDYRGPNGLWTQIKKTGTFSITKVLDLSNAEPTYTHMAIRELCRRRLVKHVVSQNCDGLHLRSGIRQVQLSEIHGNMYIEVCPTCERQYYRDVDVTQATSRFRHKTGRQCHECAPEAQPSGNQLVDTIVLYGERSRSKWPMNWERASEAAERADLIICMGSSLKTLRRYGCLWPKSSSSKKSKSTNNTKLVIINLQHTPKDKNAALKINGKCDLVMQQLLQRLNISVPAYHWTSDPLLQLAVPFTEPELTTLKRASIFDLKRSHHHHLTHSSEISTSPMGQQYEDDDRTAGSSPPASSSASSCASASPTAIKRSSTTPTGDENRDSPSLFVSELTDDPDKKRLRMRIRAVNVGATGSSKSPELDDIKQQTAELGTASTDCDLPQVGAIDRERDDSQDSSVVKENKIKLEPQAAAGELYNLENLSHPESIKLNLHLKKLAEAYAPPGWLGKSLGISKSSSYRRKRHGNKGRKRAAVVVAPQPTA